MVLIPHYHYKHGNLVQFKKDNSLRMNCETLDTGRANRAMGGVVKKAGM